MKTLAYWYMSWGKPGDLLWFWKWFLLWCCLHAIILLVSAEFSALTKIKSWRHNEQISFCEKLDFWRPLLCPDYSWLNQNRFMVTPLGRYPCLSTRLYIVSPNREGPLIRNLLTHLLNTHKLCAIHIEIQLMWYTNIQKPKLECQTE